ncbi:hypothetical protein HDU91_003902, partial [Kappamyces sp. JEL0680]
WIRALRLSYLSPLTGMNYGLDQKLSHIASFIAGCPLVELVVDVACLNNDDLWMITKGCTNLNRLVLTSGTLNHGHINDEGLHIICKNLPSLQHLVLNTLSVSAFTERGLLALAGSFNGRLLTFGLQCWPSSPVPASSPKSTLAMFESSSANSTSSSTSLDNPWEARDRFVEALCVLIKSHPYLETVIFDWPYSLAVALDTISEHCTRIRSVSLKNTSVQEEFTHMLSCNPNIEKLSLYEV